LTCVNAGTLLTATDWLPRASSDQTGSSDRIKMLESKVIEQL
jgi:hypothetical protein